MLPKTTHQTRLGGLLDHTSGIFETARATDQLCPAEPPVKALSNAASSIDDLRGSAEAPVEALLSPRLDRLVYPVKEVEVLLALSHSSVYRAIAAGRLDARKIGGKTVVTWESICRFLASLPKVR
jgi:hypothetical protein